VPSMCFSPQGAQGTRTSTDAQTALCVLCVLSGKIIPQLLLSILKCFYFSPQ